MDLVQQLNILKKIESNTMLGHFQHKYNPWKILIGTILSARARDEVTEVICVDLFKKYPTCTSLANAKQKEVEQIIRRIGFFRNKAKNIINTSKMIIKEYNGKVPSTMEELLTLPGVGRKVAGCVSVYAFDKNEAIPVDTHVHRISNRLGWVQTKQPEKTEQELMKKIPKRYWKFVNDILVSYGKTVCKPINPQCHNCALEKSCPKIGVKA